MKVLTGLFVLAAIVLGGFGVLSLSEATLGVGLLAAACLAGILARLAQASAHQSN